MSLADAYREAKKAAPVSRLDEIYRDLSPQDRETLVEMFHDPELSAPRMADALTGAGHRIGRSTISDARRRGWEPL